MNIAFPAIIALIVFLPGLLILRVRRKLKGKASTLPPSPAPLSSEAALALMFAAILNLAWYGFVDFVLEKTNCDIQIEPRAIVMFLTGKFGAGDAEFDWACRRISDFPVHVGAYFLGLYLVTALLASAFGPRIDEIAKRVGVLQNRDGRLEAWGEFFRMDDKKSITLVTAVIEISGSPYLFLGVLRGLHFDESTGELDRLQLGEVARAKFDDNNPEGHEFKPIFGNQFMVRYSEIKTLNVVYADRKIALE